MLGRDESDPLFVNFFTILIEDNSLILGSDYGVTFFHNH